MTNRYAIAPDCGSITCKVCGLVSYNKNDVEMKFCGHCNVFHDDEERNEILHDSSLSDMVKRAMVRFWRRIHEIERERR